MSELLALTSIGLEDVLKTELLRAGAAHISAIQGAALCSVASLRDACRIVYQTRIATKIVLLLGRCVRSKDLDSCVDSLTTTGLDDWVQAGKSFVVEAESHDDMLSTPEIEEPLGARIHEKFSMPVNFKNPEVTFFALATSEEIFFGVDLSGTDLGRRPYRVFLGAEALKGHIAAGLLAVMEYDGTKTLLDPFCRNGIIPIEAALMATRTPVWKYATEKLLCTKLADPETFTASPVDNASPIIAMDDQFRHVAQAKKNAKIAGIIKCIDFSRTDLQWLDAKFGKRSIDMIATMPVQPSNRLDVQKAGKLVQEFFYQAEYILKPQGKIGVVVKQGMALFKEQAAKYKFKLVHEREVMQGKEKLVFLVFTP
ncbi:hypothetical protein HY642_03385 [Candidatus Woesearchaeota archaeon]|nr:hypothetical protein [Candidatus Woesearchaeota archaeon]